MGNAIVALTSKSKYAYITEKREYPVYGLWCTNDGFSYLILDDKLSFPVWCPSTDAECSDPKVPDDWEFHMHEFNPRIPSNRDSPSKGKAFFQFLMGPRFLSVHDGAYSDLVEGHEYMTSLFVKYVESQARVSLQGEGGYYEYDKRKIGFRIETHPEVVLLDSDTIKSWEPPYQNEFINDEEKALIQKRISMRLEIQGVAHSWI